MGKADSSFASHAVLHGRILQGPMHLLASQSMALWKQHESRGDLLCRAPHRAAVRVRWEQFCPGLSVWCLIVHRLRRLKMSSMKINGHWWSRHGNSRWTLSMSSKWEPDLEKTLATMDFGVNGVLRWCWKPALLVHTTSSPCPSSCSSVRECFQNSNQI